MSNSNNTIDYNKLISFIWSVADECLRDIYTRGKYRDVIVPMTLITRFDAVLAPQKENILKEYKEYKSSCEKDGNKFNEELFLKNIKSQFGLSFYNTYELSLADVIKTTDAKNLKEEFNNYIKGFSQNVIDILENFKFIKVQIDNMHDSNILGSVIRKFTSSDLNLSPYDSGSNKGLDNHAMGTLFEEIIRKFNEENNEEAGEHFTPRDVVELIADLAISPVIDQIKPSTYRIYDGACGTFGMGSVAEERLKQYTEQLGFNIKVNLYGQEVNSETFAISKADLLIKGEDNNEVFLGSTLSKDGFSESKFDFMLSNPPYGKDWNLDLNELTDDDEQNSKDLVTDPRFVIDNYDESGELRMLPDLGDGQLLFLMNNVSKMKSTGFGSRIVEVHNGSALFNGDAGTGANNIRRYIIENDLLEAVIQLPVNMFYNTSITTHIWVLANKKAEHRKGKVQLIDASSFTTPLLKNLGSKRYELSKRDREYILDLYHKFEDNEYSKILNNEDLGYYKVAIETPLRQAVACTEENINIIEAEFKKLGVFEAEAEANLNMDAFQNSFVKSTKTSLGFLSNLENVNACLNTLKSLAKDELYLDSDKFVKEFDSILKQKLSSKAKWSSFIKTGVDSILLVKNENASIVRNKKNEVEYDKEAKDFELIPLNYDGEIGKLNSINKYLEKEIIPFNSEAVVNLKNVCIGYEINFLKYFYKVENSLSFDDIKKELVSLEEQSMKLFNELFKDC